MIKQYTDRFEVRIPYLDNNYGEHWEKLNKWAKENTPSNVNNYDRCILFNMVLFHFKNKFITISVPTRELAVEALLKFA